MFLVAEVAAKGNDRATQRCKLLEENKYRCKTFKKKGTGRKTFFYLFLFVICFLL